MSSALTLESLAGKFQRIAPKPSFGWVLFSGAGEYADSLSVAALSYPCQDPLGTHASQPACASSRAAPLLLMETEFVIRDTECASAHAPLVSAVIEIPVAVGAVPWKCARTPRAHGI